MQYRRRIRREGNDLVIGLHRNLLKGSYRFTAREAHLLYPHRHTLHILHDSLGNGKGGWEASLTLPRGTRYTGMKSTRERNGCRFPENMSAISWQNLSSGWRNPPRSESTTRRQQSQRRS